MNTLFDRYWEAKKHELKGFQATKDLVKEVFDDALRLAANQLHLKSQEFMSRSKTHPTKAILECLGQLGYTVGIEQRFKQIEENTAKEFAEAFPELAKKKE